MTRFLYENKKRSMKRKSWTMNGDDEKIRPPCLRIYVQVMFLSARVTTERLDTYLVAFFFFSPLSSYFVLLFPTSVWSREWSCGLFIPFFLRLFLCNWRDFWAEGGM